MCRTDIVRTRRLGATISGSGIVFEAETLKRCSLGRHQTKVAGYHGIVNIDHLWLGTQCHSRPRVPGLVDNLYFWSI